MDEPVFIPAVFYRDAMAALRWLERVFGFETITLVTDPDGNLAHSEMAFLGGHVQVSGEWEGPIVGDALMRSPQSVGRANTQFIRINMPSGLDEHCEAARAAGARIVAEPEDQFYGARVYRALDLEGHVWNFSQAVSKPTIQQMEAASGLTIRESLDEA